MSRFVRANSSVGPERLPYKQDVGGSNPSSPTEKALFSGLFSFSFISTSFRTIFHFIPDFFPFLSPHKFSRTCFAHFPGKMFFFHDYGCNNCFKHCCTIVPSALPRSSFMASPMTFPMSFGPSAPVC